jgi:hypothetical protein
MEPRRQAHEPDNEALNLTERFARRRLAPTRYLARIFEVGKPRQGVQKAKRKSSRFAKPTLSDKPQTDGFNF